MQIKINFKQYGQVLILGVFFICIALLVTLTLFNTTQGEYAKQNATNIADSAVYSGLQFQARSLNYLAYTNRAMIANQVSVGQIVSTSTWLDYVAETSTRIGEIAQMIPVIGQAIAVGADAVAAGAEYLMQTLPILIDITQSAISGLKKSQALVHRTTSAETLFFIEHIIQENDQRYQISTLGYKWVGDNLKEWNEFSQEFTSEKALDRKAATIASSLDHWIKQRNRSQSLSLFATFNKSGTTNFVKVKKINGQPKWVWEGRDASSFWVKRLKKSGFRLKWVNSEIPIPTGQSHSTASDDLGGHWLTQVPRSENIAKSRKHILNSTYEGLEGYWDLQSLDAAPENASLSLALEVILKNEVLRSNEVINGLDANRTNSLSIFHLDDNSTKNRASVSKGQLSFSRPYARRDGATEYSNLFNPFWTVRLVKSESEKKAAWASRAVVRPF